MKSQLKKSKEAGMELGGELLEGLAPVFRSREELLAEMEERRKIIDSIDRQQNWWSYPFRRRWALRRPGWMGIVHCLPQKLYLFCMVFFFKLRKVKLENPPHTGSLPAVRVCPFRRLPHRADAGNAQQLSGSGNDSPLCADASAACILFQAQQGRIKIGRAHV